MFQISRLLNSVLDLLFPKKCICCSTQGSFFCTSCQKLLLLETQLFLPFPIDSLDAVFVCAQPTTLLRHALHEMKYSFLEEIGHALSSLYIQQWKILISQHELERALRSAVIVPVPLHWRRFNERGFNQSELFAQDLSHYTGLPMIPLLQRTVLTQPQVQLNREQRLSNLSNAFTLNTSSPFDPSFPIILVDDVCTTGSTLRECATLVRSYGATHIYGMVLAHGI